MGVQRASHALSDPELRGKTDSARLDGSWRSRIGAAAGRPMLISLPGVMSERHRGSKRLLGYSATIEPL